MISFKSFVRAIHEAIVYASDSLMDKNENVLKKYFVEVPATESSPQGESLSPKIVRLEYPTLDSAGKVVNGIVQVPLISLVPITSTKIEKATVSAEFELEVINDELQINFSNKASTSGKSTFGRLEIIVSPQETTEGMDLLIDSYANALKRQLS